MSALNPMYLASTPGERRIFRISAVMRSRASDEKNAMIIHVRRAEHNEVE